MAKVPVGLARRQRRDHDLAAVGLQIGLGAIVEKALGDDDLAGARHGSNLLGVKRGQRKQPFAPAPDRNAHHSIEISQREDADPLGTQSDVVLVGGSQNVVRSFCIHLLTLWIH
jgi:hypothetical protein